MTAGLTGLTARIGTYYPLPINWREHNALCHRISACVWLGGDGRINHFLERLYAQYYTRNRKLGRRASKRRHCSHVGGRNPLEFIQLIIFVVTATLSMWSYAV